MSTTATASTTLLKDNGLGLGDFLKPSTPEATIDPVVEKALAEAPTIPAVTGQPDPAKEAGLELEKHQATDEKAKAEPKDETKIKADPELDRLKKQLKDTRDAFTQERQQNKQLLQKQAVIEAKLDKLDKKFDGTYDEAKDGAKVLGPEQQMEEARKAERIKTSHLAAVEIHGEKYVLDTIWADEAPFRQFDHDPVVQARVFSSPVPILEAIKVVKEAEAKAKYGADPESMRKAIEHEIREKIEAETREKLLKEFKQKGSTAFETVKGLGGTAGAAGTTPSEPPRVTLESLFPNFNKTAG